TDIEALYAGGAPPTKALAADAGLPGGIEIGHILDGTALYPRPAVADHYGVSYATTEVWAGYPQVWMQPMYVPVTGWADGVPQKLLDANHWHPVFSVGPGSGFYSPFWQAVYFTVPPGTTPATYTTVKQILDAGFPLAPREGWTIPIVPADVTSPVVGPTQGTGWVDGAKVSFLNFGERLFNWDPATNVVEETPLFVMVTRDASGNLVAPSLPTLGGTGPLGTHAGPAPLNGVAPIYASYWRLYTVEIPPTARVFTDDNLQQALAAAGLPDLGLPVDAGYANVVGRVVLNPGCTIFDPMASGTGACQYLDSQAALESNLDPGAIQPTDITVTCPFLTYQDGLPLTPITP
ncbi:MAG TPA: hypothetical protein VI456_12175, partial [Polyangia bacterium]